MKRLLNFFILAFIIVSCSKGNGKSTDSQDAFVSDTLLGAWAYKTVKVNGKESQYVHVEDCKKDFFRFSIEGNTYYLYEEFRVETCDDCDGCATIGTAREWALAGEAINFYKSPETIGFAYTILSITDTELHYCYETDYDNDGFNDEIEITALRYNPN
jgi:hypothetical protein